MSKQLESFLKKPENMHGREALLMHVLFYDIKLAAARDEYYLNSYFDDVDHDGFDVILDDQNYIKKIQVKSVGAKNVTQSWAIHKKILRPSRYLLDRLGFDSSPEGKGTEGGVVLIKYRVREEALEITYHYTDVFVLLAFECGIVFRKDGRRQKAISKCFSELQSGLGNEKVKVPFAAFIEAKNPDSLLALMGLHNTIDSFWKHHVIQIANHSRQFADQTLDLPMPLNELRKLTAQEIVNLSNDVDMCVKNIN